jgi:phosphatidylserine decarboxylase
MVYFFRDPHRVAPPGDGLVLAPADGRVMVAGRADSLAAPPGAWQQVSVFLSPLDVHINRTPVGGRVTRVAYTPGRFLAAFRREAAHENERNELWIDTGRHTVVARQVVGVLARRIVCRIAEGATVVAGERFGLMKFGSRMDVFLPLEARLAVREGARVRGGESIIAHLPDAGPSY